MIEITDEMVAEAVLAGLPPETAWSPTYVEFDLRAAIAAVACVFIDVEEGEGLA